MTELCVMTPDISCRSLIQIGLQIPRWRTKCQPRKGMTVCQAFIIYFKWDSLLHCAVCQHLCWAFLFSVLSKENNWLHLANIFIYIFTVQIFFGEFFNKICVIFANDMAQFEIFDMEPAQFCLFILKLYRCLLISLEV